MGISKKELNEAKSIFPYYLVVIELINENIFRNSYYSESFIKLLNSMKKSFCVKYPF